MTQSSLSELSPAKRALREARLRGRYQAAPIVPRERAGDAPLSHAQERLWFLDRLYPGLTAYNLLATLRLPGALDVAVLERALAEVVRRHDVLRTTFREVNGAPVQVVAPFTGFTLPVEDLSALPPGAREAQVRARVARERAHVFDLSAGPVFRASLLRLDAGDHVLLAGTHHIVSDGWSLGVFLRELGELYAAYRDGWDSPLAPLPVQYADYAAWQRSQPPAAEERHLAYWRRQLGGAPELLELPTDRPRTPVPSFRGARVPVEAPLAVLDRLRALANAQGATLHMVLTGAFQVLLARYAATQDVSVGIAVSGRSRREIEGLIGPFVNTLVLRTDLSGDPTFRAVVDRVREMALDAYQHQEVPFERVVAEVRPQRSLSHSALFQVLFLLDELAPASPGESGPGVEPLDSEPAGTTQVDLTLTLRPHARGLSGGLEYATDLFDEGTARRMAGHLERVLALLSADPDTRLSAVELLDETERRRVLETWSGAEAAPPPSGLLHALIAAQAERTPDAVAVVFEDEALTWRGLEARATRLARHLARLGAGPEARVGVCLERGPEMVVALLAVLKAGAAYLPLDPHDPAERRAYMLEDAGARLLVTQSSLRGLFASEEARIVVVDGEEGAIAAEAAEAPRNSVVPENTAYVIYTSGSTGRPKGVVVSHANAVSLLAGMDGHVGGTMPGTWLAVSRLNFDPHVVDLLWTLARGFRVVIHPEPERARAEQGALERRIRRHGVTHLQCTPSLLRMLLEESGVEALAGLERLFLGAEPLPPELVRELGAVVSGGVVNLYGPTETTVWATAHEVRSVTGRIPVGSPIAGVRVYVVDGALRPQPVGVPGEVCIAGPGVARGYLNRPGMTAERFVPDPFAATPGARMYRTGDRARWVEGAVLDFLGRMDAQVKIRGFRIEPGEIEAVLSAHPAVRVARVVVREDAPDEKRLVAYLVGDVEADALREHLREGLPEYMVPAAFVVLDELPVTPNGKLDFRALPAPEPVAADARPAAPRTPTEEILAQLWAEVLRRESVGVDDDFFALGGHSLLATRLLSRVQNTLGVVLPLRAVFEAPTVAALAARVDALRQGGSDVLPPVVPVDRDRPLPLSFAQERLWFLDRLEGGSVQYNLPAALRLTGALDAAALERSLGEIVRRHEALRTVFREGDGGAVQVIVPFAGFTLPVDDLSGLPQAARETEVWRRAREDAARPFDLAEGPLFRAALLRVADEEHILLLCIHHIVFDGWSTGVLHRELGALYAAFARGEPDPLPPLPVQYADYAVWQREQLRSEGLDRQIGYWKQRLAGAPALLELPTDRPRPPVQSHRGAMEPFDLPRALLDRLQALGRSEGATLYMVMLGAFQLLLSKYSGSEDIVVGSPIAGRTRREVEELIGFFANTLVLRTDLSGDPSFRELLGRVREGALGAYEHQEVPFERLVAELQPQRSLSHSPVFQVMFALQNGDRSGFDLSGLRMEWGGAEVETTKVDLSLTAVPHDGGIGGALEYSTALFDRSTVRRMLGHLERVLEQVAADADVRLSQLELLSAEERRMVVEAWNAADVALPAGVCVHELFEAQVERTPGATALVFENQTLDYAELNARANRLAHHLRSLGVGPEARVGICVERGLEMVVGVLGVLKAGGAYVPLDPSYPAERLAYTLADSAPAAVLVQTHLRDRAERAGVPVLELDEAAPAWVDRPVTNPERGALTPDHPAYVIYTSGSTGRPKGVSVSHRSLGATLAVAGDAFGFGGGDRVPSLASFAFDIWLFETLLPLVGGGTVRLVPRDRVPDVPRLVEDLASSTVLHAVPALMRRIVEEVRATPGGVLSTLRHAFVGGDAVAPDLLEEMRIAFPAAEIHVLYGPTEAAIICASHRLESEPATRQMVGRPLGNAALYVVERAGKVAPVGVPGELCLGGASVARDYLGRPGLTAERFVPDPFASEPGARLYRTGDRVRWLADGSLEFLGRTDFQVKVRGFRIEPGEIEARLLEHAAVREAVVLVRENNSGEKRLVAYVAGDETATADVLRAHLSERLPEYMVPAAYVRLETLPLTPNGKVDRGALPAPEGDAFSARLYEAPSGKTEEAVAAIWAGLLGVERVGRHDGFFHLGGNSLLATRLVFRIRREMDVELSVRDIFEKPELSLLAQHILDAQLAEFDPDQIEELLALVRAADTG